MKLILKTMFLLMTLTFSFSFINTDAAAEEPSRVRAAHREKDAVIKKIFSAAKINYPPREIFFRAFKQEPGTKDGVVELWARDSGTELFTLIKKYNVCSASGAPGPKRQEGDYQVPEGFYTIDLFNPTSSYLLSMRISYPNKSDRILGVKGKLGGDIYIHGNCASIGCLSMTDDFIQEIYVIASDTKKTFGYPINIHIFPTRMTDSNMRSLMASAGKNEELKGFWKNITEGYRIFEETKLLPVVSVDSKGKYIFIND